MSVMRFDPFGDPFRQIDRLTNQLLSGTRVPMGMPMDVWQADDGYHVALDLPGVDPSSVEITHERNVLTIQAERRPDYAPDQPVLVAERPQGSFTRQLQLGESLDTQNVQASYADGVLHLTIPVAQAAQPRRIEVRTGAGQGGQRQIEVDSGQQSTLGSGNTGQGSTRQGTTVQGQTVQGQTVEGSRRPDGAQQPAAASAG